MFALTLLLAIATPSPAWAIHRGHLADGHLIWESWTLDGSCQHTPLIEPRTTDVVFTMATGDVDLGVPLVAGAKQLVLVDLPGDFVFVPDSKLGMERHLSGYWSEEAVEERDRDCLDQIRNRLPHPVDRRSATLYVAETRVLRGELSEGVHGSTGAHAAIAGLFGMSIAGLLVGYKRLTRAAERERVDAILAEEIANL